jgi:hypothetical protein
MMVEEYMISTTYASKRTSMASSDNLDDENMQKSFFCRIIGRDGTGMPAWETLDCPDSRVSSIHSTQDNSDSVEMHHFIVLY